MLTKEEAEKLTVPYKKDGEHYRKVVPSPLPVKILDNQLKAIKLLTNAGCIVVCAGGGGIPCVEDPITGRWNGTEAVIDKDRAACMLGLELDADGLLILTDVSAVAVDYQSKHPKWIKSISPHNLQLLASHFPDGSMGPKVESVIDFVKHGSGKRWAAIGSLKEVDKIMKGEAGTIIQERDDGKDFIEFYDGETDDAPVIQAA